jgi:hypothetical protein
LVGAMYTHFLPLLFPPSKLSNLIIASSNSTVLPEPVGAVRGAIMSFKGTIKTAEGLATYDLSERMSIKTEKRECRKLLYHILVGIHRLPLFSAESGITPGKSHTESKQVLCTALKTPNLNTHLYMSAIRESMGAIDSNDGDSQQAK